MDSLTGSNTHIMGHHRTQSSASSGGFLAPPVEVPRDGLVPTASAQASRYSYLCRQLVSCTHAYIWAIDQENVPVADS